MSLARWMWAAAAMLALGGGARTADGGDWPMWRYNASRGAATPHALPPRMSRQWSRQLPMSQPAWPATQAKLQFDRAPEPVVAGRQIFVPSNVTDSVAAYDTRTGQQQWQFFANAPVRLAPVAAEGRVYFVSDDGHLYALDDRGRLLWRQNGGPALRPVLGNGRLISSWPARGGPVLHEGRLYFAASIWPFMGIFVHAVDPQTGSRLWTNSGDGTNYVVHPHNAPSFGTVAPQGHLVAVDGALLAPGGRSTPAVYDAADGALRHFHFDKRAGGHAVMASGGSYFVGGGEFDLATGRAVGSGRPVTADDQMLLLADGGRVKAVAAAAETSTQASRDRRGNEVRRKVAQRRELFTATLQDPPGDVFIKAGEVLYCAGAGRVSGYRLPEGGEPVWSGQFEGQAASLLAADDRLFVVTTDSVLLCFGAADRPARRWVRQEPPQTAPAERWDHLARQIVRQRGAAEGVALVWGVGSGGLIDALLQQTASRVIVVDSDRQRVDSFRRRMTQRGLYGRRVSCWLGDPASFPAPPYLANLAVSEDPLQGGQARIEDLAPSVYRSLRPYGGSAAWELSDEQHQALAAAVEKASLANAELRREGRLSRLIRQGALPGSDDWTHQYANAAQTVVSRDSLVRAPLGLLWFGGASHAGILPRHGHGPSPQVAGGRLVIEGPDMLRAVDVYTGRVLWEHSLPGLGEFYDNTAHQPGAGEIGSNYVTLADRIYVAYGDRLLELDAAGGEQLRVLELPPGPDGEPAYWGYLGVSGDFLAATSSPVAVDSRRAAATAAATRYRPLIPAQAVWKYRAGTDPPDGWAERQFDDAGWKSGAAGFGYGDNDDRTELPEMRNRYRRVYIRRTFDGDVAQQASRMGLMINYDDGFVAYVNGREVLRRNVRGDGEAAEVSSHEAGGHEFIELEDFRSWIRPGANVLAIVGHNVSLNSSDFTLDPQLVYVPQAKKGADVADNADKASSVWRRLPAAKYGSGSRRLVVFNRISGKQLWQRDAVFNFRHNNIALSADRLFCIDRLTDSRLQALARRGIELDGKPALLALDLRTGRTIWSTKDDVFGTFLNYNAEYDTLVQAGSMYRDRARDENGTGIVAYRGSDGKVLWANRALNYGGPCLLWQDKIITNGGGGFGLDLQTGEPTGWSYLRNYGCNTAVGCQHMLTFRSGAAGFFDLLNDSGTGNLGGFKSSCTSNLIPANGVLNAPDYTRTCTCAYQNQTSLALVHMPEAEFWTFGAKSRPGRLGVNLGAPGDRRSAEGTLWLDVPSQGGSSDQAVVRFEPEFPELFRHHASIVESGPLPWVAASGAAGLRRLTIEVEGKDSRRVNLVFLEPESMRPGDRVFDVSIQGRLVAERFDIARAAGGSRRSVVKSFDVQPQNGQIVVELTPRSDAPPLLSGVELVE